MHQGLVATGQPWVAWGRALHIPRAALQHLLKVPEGCTAPEVRWGWDYSTGQGIAPTFLWSTAVFAPARPLSCPWLQAVSCPWGLQDSEHCPCTSSSCTECSPFLHILDGGGSGGQLPSLSLLQKGDRKEKPGTAGGSTWVVANTSTCPGASLRASAALQAVQNGLHCLVEGRARSLLDRRDLT